MGQLFGYLIMKSLISAALIFGAAVVANATGTAPLPPPPPPPAPPAAPLHYRPPVHYRPRYGPPSHGGGLEGILPLLPLGKNCKDPHDCVKPNTHNTLCGDKPHYKKCCVCS